MRRLCPKAWLLDSANPLPRLCQAAHELGVKTAGFCAVSIETLAMTWRAMTGATLEYPFTPAREAYEFVSAGLNHFCWLLELRDRRTGADLMGSLRQALTGGATTGQPRADEMFRRTGWLMVPNDGHTRDFLPPSPLVHAAEEGFHGNTDERRRRMEALRKIADGGGDMRVVTGRSCWERPMDFIAAIAYGRPVQLHALDLVNAEGQIPNLPAGAFVETPCAVDSAGPHPRHVRLPEAVQPLAANAAAVTDAIVRAALDRSTRKLAVAVELDPTITDKSAGWRGLQQCLRAHQDVLPRYE
jgi:alpha-galactosidase